MTNAQKNGLRYAGLIVGAAATIAFSAGVARNELDGKEDRAQHAADVRALQAALDTEKNAAALQHVRDSATMSVILDRVNDVACQQNPSRSYCR